MSNNCRCEGSYIDIYVQGFSTIMRFIKHSLWKGISRPLIEKVITLRHRCLRFDGFIILVLLSNFSCFKIIDISNTYHSFTQVDPNWQTDLLKYTSVHLHSHSVHSFYLPLVYVHDILRNRNTGGNRKADMTNFIFNRKNDTM